MKLLLDTCVWGSARKHLEDAGHDVVWAGDWPPDPGDEEILDRARRDGRVLVTLDKDFGELAILRGQRHSGILRLVNLSAQHQGSICLRIRTSYGGELRAGAIVTVEPGYLRIRPPTSTHQST